MKTLNEIQEHLKSILPQGVDLTFEAIKAQLIEGTDKYNDLLLLEGRYREVGRQLLQGVTSNEDAQIEFNKIRKDLLEFIDTLQESQLVNMAGEQADDRPDIYNGEVFYRIPNEMQLEQESKCIVRLAFDRNVIVEDLEVQVDDVLKDLRISEVMGVELLDAHGNCFTIRTLNDAVQFVDKDLYTEWIFYVKPIATGTHPLTLKISIIEIRDGIERKRNVVLEEQVVVVTEEVKEKDGEMKKAAYALQVGQAQAQDFGPPRGSVDPSAPAPKPSTIVTPSPSVPSPSPAAGGKSTMRKIAPIISGIFAIVIASWAAIQSGIIDLGGGDTIDPVIVTDIPDPSAGENVVSAEELWEDAKKDNTRDAYEEFVASVEDAALIEAAQIRLDSIETATFEATAAAGTVAAAEYYLEEYPDGRYAELARLQIENNDDVAGQEEPESRIRPSRPERNNTTNPARREQELREAERRRVQREQLRREQENEGNTEDENTSTEVGQNEEDEDEVEEAISMRRTSRKPIYPGCKNDKKRDKEEACTEERIRKFLSDKLKYPQDARRRRIEGTVTVLFVIEKDGSVTEVQAVKGPGGGCEEEAIRLIKSLPKFEPGLNRAGELSRVKYLQPITFKLR